MFNTWVEVAIATPVAAAAAAGTNQVVHHDTVMTDPSMAVTVGPMARLAMALLHTPVNSNSSSSSSSGRVELHVADRTAKHRKFELSAIASAAACMARAAYYLETATVCPDPEAVAPLLMVNLACVLQSYSRTISRSQQQQQQQPAHVQLLLALGLQAEDAAVIDTRVDGLRQVDTAAAALHAVLNTKGVDSSDAGLR
jgi:hypothetical protein